VHAPSPVAAATTGAGDPDRARFGRPQRQAEQAGGRLVAQRGVVGQVRGGGQAAQPVLLERAERGERACVGVAPGADRYQLALASPGWMSSLVMPTAIRSGRRSTGNGMPLRVPTPGRPRTAPAADVEKIRTWGHPLRAENLQVAPA